MLVSLSIPYVQIQSSMKKGIVMMMTTNEVRVDQERPQKKSRKWWPQAKHLIKRIIHNPLCFIMEFLYSFHARHANGFTLVLILFLLVESGLTLLLNIDNLLCVAIGDLLAFLAILSCHCLLGKINTPRRKQLCHTICMCIVLAIVIFMLSANAANMHVISLIGGCAILLLLDTLYTLSKETDASGIFFIAKIVLFALIAYWVFHSKSTNPWGNASSLLQSISDFFGESGTILASELTGIALSAGGVLVLKDALDVLNVVPYRTWNHFSYGKLRLRKSAVLVLVSGYMIMIFFWLWRGDRDTVFRIAVVVSAIVVSAIIAKIPAPREPKIRHAVATTLLSEMSFPIHRKSQQRKYIAIVKGNEFHAKSLITQLKVFNREWRLFAKEGSFDQQKDLLLSIGNLVECTLACKEADDVADLFMFLIGVYCAPIRCNMQSAIAKFHLIESDSWNMYKKHVVIAGMKCGRYVKDPEYAKSSILTSAQIPARIRHFMNLIQSASWEKNANMKDGLDKKHYDPTMHNVDTFVMSAVYHYLAYEEAAE